MKVVDFAKELNTSPEAVLDRLRSLKLKAKDGQQELNSVVLNVLRSDFKKNPAPPKGAAKGKPEVQAAKKPDAVKSAPDLKVKKVEEPKEKAKEEKKPAKPAKVEKAEKVKVKEEPPAPKKEIKETKETKKPVKETLPPVKAKEKSASVPVRAPVPAAAEIKPAPAKPKSAPEPFVTLKPLPKKRKKRFPGDTGSEPHEMPSFPRPEAVPGAAREASTVAVEEKPARQLIDLEINVPITVKDFSVRIQQKPSVVLKQLMQMGIMANINLNLPEEIVRKLAVEFGFNLTKVKTQEQQLIDLHALDESGEGTLKPRAPVVTFMGHVDHGKTSLLDKIRKTKVAEGEHGGITQHIGAYSVRLSKGNITFLDTPGHEAFTAMRARGARITDLVVLVVAADEGIMPQTEEALNHAQAANVPIIIALNKIDKKSADPDRVKKQLAEKGLNPEDWGGKTIVAGVSALTGEGIDHLLDMILLEAELLELKANYEKRASGIVVEAHMSQGKGAVADLIVQNGTLREGDLIVSGPYYGKIKAMRDDRDRPLKEAGPSTAVEILGLPGVPEAGEVFYVINDEKLAKDIANQRQDKIKSEKLGSMQKITLEDLYIQIKEGNIKEFNLILKADVQGSLEALKDSLEKIPSTEIKVRFIHTGVGDVNASDVLLAVASNAVIICFHVGIDQRAQTELEKQPVDVREYRIIYDAVNDIRKALEGLLEPKLKRKFVGRVEIRQVMKLSRSGIVAGCFVQKGKVRRKDKADVVRNGEVVHSGSVSTLKRFKDDVKEVTEGTECGLTIHGFDAIQVGDIVEVYEVEQIARTL